MNHYPGIPTTERKCPKCNSDIVLFGKDTYHTDGFIFECVDVYECSFEFRTDQVSPKITRDMAERLWNKYGPDIHNWRLALRK